LLIITLMVINSFAIFSSFVNSLEIEFNYPSEVELNREFKVSIDFEANDTYDVKIFAYNSKDTKVTRDEYISDIYNSEKNSWQDSWNYLAASFPNQKEYSIKVTKSPGDRQICARVRKTGASSSFSKCGSITVKGVENAPSPTILQNNSRNQNNNQDNTKSSDKENVVVKANNKNNDVQKTRENIQEESPDYENISYDEIVSEGQEQKNEKIYLNPKKSNESGQSREITTKKGKTLFMMFYVFSFIGVLILVMLVLKKL